MLLKHRPYQPPSSGTKDVRGYELETQRSPTIINKLFRRHRSTPSRSDLDVPGCAERSGQQTEHSRWPARPLSPARSLEPTHIVSSEILPSQSQRTWPTGMASKSKQYNKRDRNIQRFVSATLYPGQTRLPVYLLVVGRLAFDKWTIIPAPNAQ